MGNRAGCRGNRRPFEIAAAQEQFRSEVPGVANRAYAGRGESHSRGDETGHLNSGSGRRDGVCGKTDQSNLLRMCPKNEPLFAGPRSSPEKPERFQILEVNLDGGSSVTSPDDPLAL